MIHPLRERIQSGRIVKGVACSMASPATVEWLARSWDFVWIDAQHGEWSMRTVPAGVSACKLGGGCALVRVPGHEYGVLGPFADMAPEAMMIPMVDTAEQARQVTRALCFPPAGNRSYGGRSVYDRLGADYYQDADTLFVMAQVESPESVEHAAEIVGTAGIDALFVGAADLRIRLDLPMAAGVADTPALRQAFTQVARAAREAGKASGCVVTDDGVLNLARELGMQILSFGSDAGFIRNGSATQLDELAKVGL